MGTIIGVLEKATAVLSTNSRFIRLAPIKLPNASPPYPFLAEEITVDSSGKLVPSATIVAEMMASEIPILLAETWTVATKKLELNATIKPEIMTFRINSVSLATGIFSLLAFGCAITSSV